MKQIIIFLLLIILGIMGYNAYERYHRFHGPGLNYQTDAPIDPKYHNPKVVEAYDHAIERLNGFVAQQWSFYRIDVRAPKKDNPETKAAVMEYQELLSDVRTIESILTLSTHLKKEGYSDLDVKNFEQPNYCINDTLNPKTKMLETWLAASPGDFDFGVGAEGPLVYEIQGMLNLMGAEITHDGIYRLETANAVEEFETARELYADGRMDPLTANELIRVAK